MLFRSPPNVPNIAASPYALNTPAHSSPSRSSETDSSYSEAESKTPKKMDSRTKEQLRKDIRETQRKMQQAAKNMDFLVAARLRDEIKELQRLLDDAR